VKKNYPIFMAWPDYLNSIGFILQQKPKNKKLFWAVDSTLIRETS
jgi:hypothetical protein